MSVERQTAAQMHTCGLLSNRLPLAIPKAHAYALGMKDLNDLLAFFRTVNAIVREVGTLANRFSDKPKRKKPNLAAMAPGWPYNVTLATRRV